MTHARFQWVWHSKRQLYHIHSLKLIYLSKYQGCCLLKKWNLLRVVQPSDKPVESYSVNSDFTSEYLNEFAESRVKLLSSHLQHQDKEVIFIERGSIFYHLSHIFRHIHQRLHQLLLSITLGCQGLKVNFLDDTVWIRSRHQQRLLLALKYLCNLL